ncbi:SAUR family protein [Marchantia polymorpha subsp. ruderalis]|nr:hypothetical protein Mp_1g27940 [Marchantia polymorpha subsp. ruderalis]
MDLCLGLGMGETILAFMRSRKHGSGAAASSRDEEKMSPGSSSIWSSSVSRSGMQHCSRLSSDESSRSESTHDDCSSSDMSSSGGFPSSPLSAYCPSRRLLWGSRKRSRKPAVLEKTPFGKSTEYLTVHVGVRSELSVKYFINRTLLTHPLFKLLLKCSEDEFGEEYMVKRGVAVVCDPALFLEVVRAVDDDLWSSKSGIEALGWQSNQSHHSKPEARLV